MATSRDDGGHLVLGGVRLDAIARDPAFGTPTYVYDLSAMAGEARALRAAFEGAPHLVAYAVKANSAGAVVRALVGEGCGVDVVSGAELELALRCGAPPDHVVFSGVGKTDDEIDRAISAGPRGIGAIQIESIEEVGRVAARAEARGRAARVSVRVNPAVDLAALDTHAHIATGHDEAKFGVAIDEVTGALDPIAASPWLTLVGLSVHVGSQFTTTSAYVEAARALFRLVGALRATLKRPLSFVDTGGGFGIDYGDGACARPADFVRAVRAEQRAAGLSDVALHVEPGRSLVGAHGVLLARAISSKRSGSRPGAAARRWLLIDAGMNDLLRPALYQARHRVVPLAAADPGATYRVAGPVCESSDDFGLHALPDPPPPLVAILDAGAYGFTMASVYNGRPLPAEVFLAGGRVVDARPRGSIARWIEERASG